MKRRRRSNWLLSSPWQADDGMKTSSSMHLLEATNVPQTCGEEDDMREGGAGMKLEVERILGQLQQLILEGEEQPLWKNNFKGGSMCMGDGGTLPQSMLNRYGHGWDYTK